MLALDPYYEMFPSSYRRPASYQQLWWGDGVPSSSAPGALVPVLDGTLNEAAKNVIIFSIASFAIGVGLTAATAAIMWRRRR